MLLSPMLSSGVVLLAAVLALQGSRAIPVSWVPEKPLAGNLAVLIVGPDTLGEPIAELAGSVAGEPLHFRRDAGGGYRALIPVPVTAPGRVFVDLTVRRRQGSERLLLRIPIDQREVEVERVQLPPRYVEPPDSALLVRIERERIAQLAALNRAHRTQKLWTDRFAWPGIYRVTGSFAARREINGATASVHLGIDLAAPQGTPVLAPARGVVSLVGDFFYQGKLVYLNHGSGLSTGYFHLSEILVSPGDTVELGQAIGRVGATGRVTGPHLHWVARYGRLSLDPAALFELAALERASP